MYFSNERRLYLLLLGILFLVCLGLALVIFYISHPINKNKELNPKPVIVNALPLKFEDIDIENVYVGHIEAINQVDIIPYITGFLKDITVSPGQYVNKGDKLIYIEDSEYRAKFDAARATVMQAQAAYDYDKNYYERLQKSGKKAFSIIDIDNAKNVFLQSEAALMSAEASQKIAQVNYQYTQIDAPISGLIGHFNLTIGDYVAPNGSPLLNIVQTNPIRVVFSLTDKEYLTLYANGEPFKDSVISLTLADGHIFENKGTFKYTDNKIDSSTNSIAVYADFQNRKNELLPNEYVNVNVCRKFKDTVLVDKDMINMQNNGNFVTIGRDNKIIQQPVHILAEKGNKFILKNTFKKDDVLVLDGVSQIKNSENIRFNIIHTNEED